MSAHAAQVLGVDFVAVIEELRKHGHGYHSISRATGLPESTLKNYALTGTTPLHPNGERLVGFWCVAMQLPRELAPCRPIMRWAKEFR